MTPKRPLINRIKLNKRKVLSLVSQRQRNRHVPNRRVAAADIIQESRSKEGPLAAHKGEEAKAQKEEAQTQPGGF